MVLLLLFIEDKFIPGACKYKCFCECSGDFTQTRLDEAMLISFSFDFLLNRNDEYMTFLKLYSYFFFFNDVFIGQFKLFHLLFS